MGRQPLQTIKIFCDSPIHEDTKAGKKAQCVHREKYRSQSHLSSQPQAIDGKLGRFSGSCWVPGGEINHLSQGGKFYFYAINFNELGNILTNAAIRKYPRLAVGLSVA